MARELQTGFGACEVSYRIEADALISSSTGRCRLKPAVGGEYPVEMGQIHARLRRQGR